MRRRHILVATVAAGLVILAGCDLEDLAGMGSERYTEDFHKSFPLKPGGRLSVENFNGSVEITGWDEDQVDISGTKYAGTPELRDSIRIDISAQPDSISIRTVRPSERRGNMGAKYLIKVPRKTELDRVTSSNGAIRTNGVEGPARIRTSNGTVRTSGGRGSLDAQTSNGSVELEGFEGAAVVRTSNGRVHADDLKGSIEATTTNGGINVRIAKAEPGKSVRLETSNGGVELTLESPSSNNIRVSTTNGGITLRLPAALNANLRAHTSNSSINNEFDVKASGPVSKHNLEGVIGSGGPTVEATTSNGAIRILKM